MNDRIQDKLAQIEQFLEELYQLIPETFDQYCNDFKSKAACERYVEKIIEAVVDTAHLVIREKKLRIPEDDQSAFLILQEAGIIPPESSIELQKAKGMRNFLAHEYGEVDDTVVYHALREQLENDVRLFITLIRQTS